MKIDFSNHVMIDLFLLCTAKFLYFATDDEVNNLQSKSGAKNLIESYGMHCVQIGDNYT